MDGFQVQPGGYEGYHPEIPGLPPVQSPDPSPVVSLPPSAISLCLSDSKTRCEDGEENDPDDDNEDEEYVFECCGVLWKEGVPCVQCDECAGWEHLKAIDQCLGVGISAKAAKKTLQRKTGLLEVSICFRYVHYAVRYI